MKEEKYYTHTFQLELNFTVPHCLSSDPSVSLKEEIEWVESRMMLELSDHLQKNLGLEMILSHIKTEEEVRDVIQ